MIGEESDEQAFIDLVEMRPFLYDVHHAKYRKNDVKENAWQLICDAMGWETNEETGELATDFAKRTWKRLRDNFWRVHNKIPPSGSGASVTNLWVHYKRLLFLTDVKKRNSRATCSNYKQKQVVPTSGNPTPSLRPGEGAIIVFEDGVDCSHHPLSDTQESVVSHSTDTGGDFSHESALSTGSLLPENILSQMPKESSVSQKSKSQGSSSPLPFEYASKRKAPQRINPPAEPFAKKKRDSTKKFEEILTKGIESFSAALSASQPNTSVSQPVAGTRDEATNAFLTLLALEIAEFPLRVQAIVRKDILVYTLQLEETYKENE